MRIAIVGAGISGLVSADLLHRRHEVTLFEANDRLGGHTNTIHFEDESGPQAVDTGFIVFNEKNYPNFSRILDRLGVQSRATSMSFSVRSDASGLEYNGESVNKMFSQRRNLVRPRFFRMVRDILRFYREGARQASTAEPETTVAEFARQNDYSDEFVRDHLVPMGSSLWSCPPGRFLEFPIHFVVDFFANHDMLQVTRRPVWRTIRGGSDQYIEPLVRPFRDRVRLGAPIRSVTRHEDRVVVTPVGQDPMDFDEVVFACHSDQALRMLSDPSDRERDILEAFPYQKNETVLHSDPSLLPQRRQAWACWNYHIRQGQGEEQDAAVTYNMNMLQGLTARSTYCVTLNESDRIARDRILHRVDYEHPVYDGRRADAQARHQEMIRANRTSFCGAYWGYGFHEDGVNSAIAVGSRFGEILQ